MEARAGSGLAVDSGTCRASVEDCGTSGGTKCARRTGSDPDGATEARTPIGLRVGSAELRAYLRTSMGPSGI